MNTKQILSLATEQGCAYLNIDTDRYEMSEKGLLAFAKALLNPVHIKGGTDPEVKGYIVLTYQEGIEGGRGSRVEAYSEVPPNTLREGSIVENLYLTPLHDDQMCSAWLADAEPSSENNWGVNPGVTIYKPRFGNPRPLYTRLRHFDGFLKIQ